MHQHQTDHGEHKARQQLNDHGMYPEVEAAKEELVTNTDQTDLWGSPTERASSWCRSTHGTWPRAPALRSPASHAP